MNVCLVTIAIGEKYLTEYNRLFRPSQESYARKHGYDFRVLTDFLGPVREPTTISFNKILVCSQDWSLGYDFVVFIDADILINPEAPPIHLSINFRDKIGIVDEFTQPSFQKRVEFNRRKNFEHNPTAYYLHSGFRIQTNSMLNTGVIVMQPKKHASFLKSIYDKYVQNSINHPRRFHYEQSVIGYELISNDKFIVIPNSWNGIWIVYTNEMSLEEFSKSVNFLHFAGIGTNIENYYNISGLYK